MKPVLVDTDILSMFFRNNPNVVSHFRKYIAQYKKINLSIITYYEILSMISTEFHRYLMENEEFASKIPLNALVIFQIEGEDDFNKWHKETSLRNREADQPIIYVYVKRWRKHSLIDEVNLSETVA